MIKEFEYLIEGKHSSGKVFRQEFIVIAKDEFEAQGELKLCLDYYEPVKEWKIISLKRITDVLNESELIAEEYKKSGAFTIYDPEFHFIDTD